MVVVGAGFGGLYAVRALKRADLRITVVDRRNHHLFQPLLYQVATAGLSPGDIAHPIRAVLVSCGGDSHPPRSIFGPFAHRRQNGGIACSARGIGGVSFAKSPINEYRSDRALVVLIMLSRVPSEFLGRS